jgi:hypothetical protein
MTIICYRDGIMAADSAAFSGSVRVSTSVKIIRTRNGALFAAAGACSDTQAVGKWAQNDFEGDPPALTHSEDGDFAALYVKPSGDVLRLYTSLIPIPSYADFHAEGCCLEMATGAMGAGASAEEAVRVCLQYGQGVGTPIQVESL